MVTTNDAQIDIIFTALWTRWVQLDLGCYPHPPCADQADQLYRHLQTAHARRKSGTLDVPLFRAWALERVPWLASQLAPQPQGPRRAWTPPPPPPSAPPPTAAAAELARRIAKHG